LDVFGPLEMLLMVSRIERYADIELHILTHDMKSVSTGMSGAKFQQSVVPTASFATAPGDLDVLIVPGGPGVGPMLPDGRRASETEAIGAAIAFIRTRYADGGLSYLFTICTGSLLAAQAGVLDGKRATTNKRAWARVPPFGPRTYWDAKARWVESGNVWTTAGVSAGIDGMLAFITKMYGHKVAVEVAE